MSELLGDALLALRTDDKGFSAGVENAQGKAQALGKAMDTASATASALGDKLNESGELSTKAAKAYAATDVAITKLAQAQVDASAAIGNAKAALDAGQVSQAKYNEQVLQAKTALAGVQAQYSAASAELHKHQTVVDDTTKMSGQQRMGYMVLGEQVRQVSTELSLGISPAQVFSQQIGQVIDAVQLATGGATKFGAFMMGGWGIALTAAVAGLAPFLGQLLAGHDALAKETEELQKNAEKTEATRKAKEAFGKTIIGVRAAILDEQAALDKQDKSLETSAEQALKAAQANLSLEISTRAATKAQLEHAIVVSQAAAIQAQAPGQRGDLGALGLDVATQHVEGLRAQIAQQDALIATAQSNLTRAQSHVSVEAGDRDADPVARIKRAYEGPDGLIEQARKRAVAEGQVGVVLEKQVAALKAQEEAKLKIAQAEKGDGNRQYGRDIDLSQAEAIARGAGFQVNSGLRTRAEQEHLYETVRTASNPVAAPGTSAHERGNALDIQAAAGVSVESIRKAFADQGVRLSKILSETGHFHVEWSTASADKEAAAAKKAQDDATRRQRNFDTSNDQLDAQIAAAKRGALTDLDEIARLNRDQLDAEQAKFDDDVAAKVKLKELSQADADKLVLKEAELTHLKEIAQMQATAAEKLKAQATLNSALSQHQSEILQAQLALAKTNEERRAIELQLLDLEKQEAKARYQLVIDLGKQGKASPGDVKAAQDGLDHLDATYGLKRQSTIQQTAGPLDTYIAGMKLSAAQMRDKSETLAVQELDYFRKGIDDAISKRLGIKDPLLAGLIDMLVQQWLIKPMADALSKMGGGGSGGIGGLLGSIFGGGSVSAGTVARLTPDASATISNPAFAGLFADGGLIPSGSFGIVGEAGPEPIWATAGGVGVMPNSAMRQFAGGGGPSSAPKKIEISVSGARGNAEIQDMVRQGVAQGLAAYDSQVGERVRDNLARRG